jgi:undecaprenyl-diphosphatase
VLLALLVRDVADPLVRFDQRTVRQTTVFALRHDWVRTAAEVGGYVLHPWVFRIAVLVAAAVLLKRGARSAAMWAALTMVVGTFLGAGLKLLVSRARPELDDPVATASGFSFPSGHALNAALGVSLLVALLWRPAARRDRRALLIGVGALLVLLTGLDRVVLGVHFPSDVVAGWIVGVLVVVSSWVAFGPVMRERARRGAEQAVEEGAPGSGS